MNLIQEKQSGDSLALSVYKSIALITCTAQLVGVALRAQLAGVALRAQLKGKDRLSAKIVEAKAKDRLSAKIEDTKAKDRLSAKGFHSNKSSLNQLNDESNPGKTKRRFVGPFLFINQWP